MQAHQRGSKIGVPHADVVETVSCQQDMQLVSPEFDIMDQTLVLSFTPNDDLDFSSVELSHPALPQKTTEVLADQEPGNLMGNSHQEAGIRGEHLDAVPEMPLKLVMIKRLQFPMCLEVILSVSNFFLYIHLSFS
ncbi:hypothetical protein ACH5RR_040567 [Cinchona calisaya]|uniref:Uncharacterized protein n=1 Tax=Cinchona calisaya TaxID=153742 RepID=A0ABD2XV60_9GENT